MARESLAVSEGKAGQTDCMRVTLMLLKASRITGNHSSLSKPFLPPLRAAVRDSRIFAESVVEVDRSQRKLEAPSLCQVQENLELLSVEFCFVEC